MNYSIYYFFRKVLWCEPLSPYPLHLPVQFCARLSQLSNGTNVMQVNDLISCNNVRWGAVYIEDMVGVWCVKFGLIINGHVRIKFCFVLLMIC